MLTHPTHDRLIALGLTGMAKALEDQRRQPDIAAPLTCSVALRVRAGRRPSRTCCPRRALSPIPF
jgi:hypothetical protein